MKSKFIDLKDQKVHYLEGGNGKPIILLPSLWITSRSYKNIGTTLSKKFHVIIPDLYKGESIFTKTAKSFDDYCDVLNSFLKNLNLYRVGLIGVSYSGFFASYFARKYPNKIRALILFSTTTVPLMVSHPLLIMLKGYIKLLFYNLWSIKGITINSLWIYDGLKYLIKHPLQFFLEFSMAYHFNRTKGDCHFSLPAKLFLAKNDEFMNWEEIKESNQKVKNLSIEIVKGKHAWFFQRADYFLDMIIKVM